MPCPSEKNFETTRVEAHGRKAVAVNPHRHLFRLQGPATGACTRRHPWPRLCIRRASWTRALGVVALALALGTTPAGAQQAEIVGRPRVIDVDTLDFSGRIVRLFGIDGPELDQTCRKDGLAWSCGTEARWAALNRISPHWVTCVEKARNPDGSVRAVCYLAGVGQHDLNAWLVSEGWALADRAAAPDYGAAEERARSARKGLWRGEFIAPWEWRRGRRLAP